VLSILAVIWCVAVIAFGAWMGYLARRSATGTVPEGGPGIRVAATTRCEHTWLAAQRAAARLFAFVGVAAALSGVLGIALVAAGLNGLLVALLVLFGTGCALFFFLGVASVRATHAANAVECEHRAAAKAPARGRRTKRGPAKPATRKRR